MDSTFLKKHASVIFVATLAMIAFLAAVFGHNLSTSPQIFLSRIGYVLIQISGAFITAAVTTIFFKFSDVRQHLALTAESLLDDGTVVKRLSDETRTAIAEQISLLNIGEKARITPVFAKLNELRDSFLESPHMHNYQSTEQYHARRSDGCYLVTCLVRYKFVVGHLRDLPVRINFRQNHSVMLPANHPIDENNFVQRYEIRFGDTQFNKSNARISTEVTGDCKRMSVSFQQEIEFARDTDVSIYYEMFAAGEDKSTAQKVKYPTYGFTFRFQHSEPNAFDGAWFRSDFPNTDDPYGERYIQQEQNGISTSCSDWIFPGEGFLVTWLSSPGNSTGLAQQVNGAQIGGSTEPI